MWNKTLSLRQIWLIIGGIIVGVAILLVLGGLLVSDAPSAPQNSISSDVPAISPNPQSETRDGKIIDAVFTSLASYKMPVQSGKWRTCVVERINALPNLQLISFYEWFKSLSPKASEETQLTSIARKLGCPEPVFRTIPAKTAVIKSFSGRGSQNLGAVSFDSNDWSLNGSWSGSDTKPLPEGGEEKIFAALSEERGIFLCDSSGEACSVAALGFDKPSGEFAAHPLLSEKGTFVIKVGAPVSASWNFMFFRIIEPAKTIVE